MSRFVEFPLEEGGSILIEVNEEGQGRAGFIKASEAAKDIAEPAKLSFDAAIENVRRASNVMVGKLRDLSAVPDEMQINFSLKASAELGNLALSKGGPDATYFVSLKWRREPPKPEKEEKKDEEKKESASEAPKEEAVGSKIAKGVVIKNDAAPDTPTPDPDDDGDDD